MKFKVNLFEYHGSYFLVDAEFEKRPDLFEDKLAIGRGYTKEEAIAHFKEEMIRNFRPDSRLIEILEINIPEINDGI